VVALGGGDGGAVPTFALPRDPEPSLLAATLTAAVEVVRARALARSAFARAADAEERIAALNRIGIALSAERDMARLLEKVLSEPRRFTRSEAGSLYLLEEGPGGATLRFKLAQNDAVKVSFSERTVPVDEGSLSGWVAAHGEPLVLEDAYHLSPGVPYRHNDSFDVATGWRTRSVIVVPMKDHRGEMVGVLQLMNRKGEEPGTYEPYPADLVPVLLSLATQAAVCIKANQLTDSIRKLFEDFAHAAIVAVEQRDPTTAGHSSRVAELTVALATILDRADEGPYANVRFSKEELREVGTAALLHDFGKISVPERVLVKSKKLEPPELARVRDRFDYALESGDAAAYRKLLVELVRAGRAPLPEELRALEAARLEDASAVETLWDEIRTANEPTVLPETVGQSLTSLLTRNYRDRRGVTKALLAEEEFGFLSIRKGSLSIEERRQIESHVSFTYRFLSTIPWTPDLARIPDIAYAHHEKLNGNGYPRRLTAELIPVPSRVLTVCDIYDALTASDRPYKKAVPRDIALRILQDEAKEGGLDPWLVKTFIEEKIWIATLPERR
jgi:HD-GYP domain-containing protein (c-di-GMP phosphodiesterase class II)